MQTQIEGDPILLVEYSASLSAVSAGEAIDLAVTVTNRGKQRLIVDVFIDGTENDLNRWCRCAWQRIVLDTRQARTIVFRFAVPITSPPGRRKAVVVADASSREDEDALQQLIQVCPIQFDVLETPPSLPPPNRLPKLVLPVALLGLGSIAALFQLTPIRSASGPVQAVTERRAVPRPSVPVTGNLLPGAVLRVVAEAEASQASLAHLPLQLPTAAQIAEPLLRPVLTKTSLRRIPARRPTHRLKTFAPPPSVDRSLATGARGVSILALHAAAAPLDPPNVLPLRPVPPIGEP